MFAVARVSIVVDWVGYVSGIVLQIENYSGPARIVVSLVTDEAHPHDHAHKLVGKNCNDGICTVEQQSTAVPIGYKNVCH